MEKIELRKARDFGQLFNDSIAFLRINFKSFFGAVIFLAGPFVILTGIMTGFLQYISSQITLSSRLTGLSANSTNMFAGNSASTLCIYGFIFLLTILVSNAVVALYFKAYDITPSQDLPIQRSIISPLLAAASWRLFYNLLLLIGILLIVVLAFVGIFYLISLNQDLKVFLIALLVLGYFIVAPVLVYLLTVANYIVIRDEILITAAFGKALKYMRGSFWQTWALIFCAVLSLSMLYFIFSAPNLILTVASTFMRGSTQPSMVNNSILFIVFGALSTLGSMLIINPILTCFCVFNFYNHEERHEGTSLLNRIDNFDSK